MKQNIQLFTLPETNSKFAPENGWLEDKFPFGGPAVSGSVVPDLFFLICFLIPKFTSILN